VDSQVASVASGDDGARSPAARATLGGAPKRPYSEFGKRLAPWASVLVLIGLSLAIGLSNPVFFQTNNFIRMANASAVPLVVACGLTFIIILGAIDLSVEGTLAISASVVALLVVNDTNHNAFGPIAVLLAIFVGAGMGLINGLIHVKLRIPSFMTTLGMWFVGAGLATVFLGGGQVRVLDQEIRAIALTRILNIPLPVWIAVAVMLLALGIERYTRFGRHVRAIGGAEDLAALSGINVGRVKIAAFTLAGLTFGIGGVLTAAQLGVATAEVGNGRLFSAVTAVVVGGTALTGGQGGILNTLIGVAIVALLNNGMVLLGVPPTVQQGVLGLLIIVAVALSLDRTRLRIVK
jgi:ribose transport system permease protein